MPIKHISYSGAVWQKVYIPISHYQPLLPSFSIFSRVFDGFLQTFYFYKNLTMKSAKKHKYDLHLFLSSSQECMIFCYSPD